MGFAVEAPPPPSPAPLTLLYFFFPDRKGYLLDSVYEGTFTGHAQKELTLVGSQDGQSR